MRADNEGVAVNTPIAVLLEEGESASDIKAGAAPKPAAAPAPAPEKKEDPKHAAAAPAPAPAAAAPAPKQDGARVFASPLARPMAAQDGIDLSAVPGSGPHGRIVQADIETAPKASKEHSGGEAVVSTW